MNKTQTPEWEKEIRTELETRIKYSLPYWESEDNDRFMYILEAKDFQVLVNSLADLLSQQRKEILEEVLRTIDECDPSTHREVSTRYWGYVLRLEIGKLLRDTTN